MSIADKRILVTGADGFIGSHLVESLVTQGAAVKAFTLYNSFNSWGWLDHCSKAVLNSLEVFPGDIRDPHGVKKAMQGCDLVFHLAALIAIPYSYHSPDTYIDTNVKGTLNVLQAARELSVEKVVHTSTSEVYGSAQFVPITEEHPVLGQSPYSASKIAADQLALSFYHSFDLPVGIIRPFNTYGPRQSARAIIPAAIIQIASGQNTVALGNLAPTRDFNYIEDTIQAFVAFGESPASVGEVIHIGSNHEISIGHLVNLIAELMGRTITIKADAERFRPLKSEVTRLWADHSKAKSLLNWAPRFAGLDGLRSGLEKTISWFSSADNLRYYRANLYNI